ncbi:hypothetical protein AMIS_64690 [Actinoplanes missouriensis 431]|uniref:IPT/TIG domain-containing protein n=1 Tax=Actinoplanes missouriensis (strain ATCC 14538 / DSM 43046 / CBS 188.64 / JCM 3121 / NBRC 102363 / NCIMB 12654 / NRRL B-3342 / UNCC 431) TaxID=512565 RepID=I0HFA2_ACTM4|nr:hypothetical protein [Actinoplanes missouriensis]BAL91689.1 hypothetical protein AMIS_64690 [Actinoplanes missouriensis 431]
MRKSLARFGSRPLTAVAATAVTAAAVLTASPAYAAALTVSQTQLPISGGATLTIAGGTGLASTQGIRFAPAAGSCPAQYDTVLAGTVEGGLITMVSGSGGAAATVTTPALPAGSYKVCIYANATSGLLYTTDTFAGTVTAVNMGPLSSSSGVATDKITLTAPTGIFTAAAYNTEFVPATTCADKYQTVANGIVTATTAKTTGSTATTVLTITVPALTAGTQYAVCVYAGSTANTSLLAARGNQLFAAYDKANLPAPTLVGSSGSSGVATSITMSVPTDKAVFTGTPNILATRNGCPGKRPANAALGGTTRFEPWAIVPQKVTNSKLVVSVPANVTIMNGEATTPWNLCAYASNATDANLIAAPAVYTVAPALTVSGAQFSVNGAAASGTGSGPARGGSSITITGLVGIPTAEGAPLSAKLGTSEITITDHTSTSITGTTNANAPGAVNLSVTTAAGTQTTSTKPYTFNYGINVTPNSSPTDVEQMIDILGAGFSALDFEDVGSSALTDDKAYVLLTTNAWNEIDWDGDAVSGNAKALPDTTSDPVAPVSYCNSVLPISDEEIICTLQLDESITAVSASNVPTIGATTEVPPGVYTVTVVNSANALDADENNYSVVSSGSTFTVAPF